MRVGRRAAIRHNCEDTIKCDSAEPGPGLSWDDDECGHKTSRFQLCTNPKTGGGHLYYCENGRRYATTAVEKRTAARVRDGEGLLVLLPTATTTPTSSATKWTIRTSCNSGSSIYARPPPGILELRRDRAAPRAERDLVHFVSSQPDRRKVTNLTVQAVEMATVQVRHAAQAVVVAQQPPPQVIYAPQPPTEARSCCAGGAAEGLW